MVQLHNGHQVIKTGGAEPYNRELKQPEPKNCLLAIYIYEKNLVI